MEQANCQITGVSFRLFAENESKRLSSLSIVNPTTFDPLGHPIDTGLADTALGPLKRNDFCKTCGLTDSHCLGHFGHISLPLPVFNPFLMKQLYQVLRMFCFNCHHFLFSRNLVEVYIAQLRALNLGLDFMLEDIVNEGHALTSGGKVVDWNSLEGQTYVRGKLNELINKVYSEQQQLSGQSVAPSCFAGPSKQNNISSRDSVKSEMFDDTEIRPVRDPTVNGSIATSTPSASKTHVAHVESVDIMNSKNVIEKKQHLFKDFIGGKLVKPAKVCTYCHARKAGMNVINRSLIILSASKAAQSVAKFVANDEEGDDNDRQNASTINIEMKGKSYLTPSQAREHLRLLWGNESDTLLRIFPFINFDVDEQQGLPGVQLDFDNQSLPDAHQSPCPLDVFFWETILVSPNRFRPLRFLNGRSFEHYRTSALSELMIVAKSLEYALETAKKNATGSKNGDSIARFHSQWQRLQILCNRLYDAKMDNLPDNKAIGVKQILEKKEGLLRKNMMGKRVNFAARSVISPDPYIMADEIGVPVIFATRLSYPQPVTNWNVKQLQEMVINGPNVHPGALSVMYEDGFTVRLKPEDIGQRRSVAATLHAPTLSQGMNGVKIVNRHLISGDVLLLNRQPTLHKPSIMAHKARVLPREKTLRLHYANCKCYNADFDGDEMNAHFPQSELARAEAYGIASVNYQFLVPKDGSPLSGLIQDHIVAGVMMTVRGKFFNKSDYQELVYGALSFLDRRIKFLPPTILKPEQLWSGKQIISTLVINLVPKGKPLPSFDIESKVSPKMLLSEKAKDWKYGGSPLKDKEMCESQVVFRRGELLCGLMDKVNFGANKNGLIHCCYELYGGDIHTKLLTAIARVSTNYLQSHHGFTLGIHDILVRSKPNVKRRKLIDMAGSLGQQAVADAFGMKSAFEDGTLTHEAVEEKLSFAHTSKDDFYMKQLDAAYKSYTDNLSNQISSTCLPKGLVKTFPSNNLQMMIQTGAKGGSVNAIQISALLGQIELEGRRIPLMMSGRTLPSFQPYETHPRAGGFVTGRFLTGIRPQEFFFHCMAGREGLIDTAVKTSRSGYLQRCLIKHLEGLVVNYDLTVRDSEGSVVQWMYGEDGLDVTRSQSLNKSFFPTIMKNRDALKPTKDELERLKAARDPTVTKQVVTVRKSLEAEKKHKPAKNASNTRESPFLRFESELKEKSMSMDAMPKKQIVDSWFGLHQKEKYSFYQQLPKAADPVISRYRPDLNFGAISETLDSVILNYCDSELATLSRSTRKEDKKTLKEFKNTLNVCYMRALCAPGEAVGLLAAQSIGEPSTQMTLNTFHFAGRGEMNVTLGVPRLRELLMTASPNISTPSMDIPFRTDLPPELAENVESEAEKIRLRLNAVRLKDVLEYVDVVEMLEIYDTEAHHRYRNYNLRFQFLPRSSYKRRCFTKPAKVLHFMETQFIKQFIDAMNRRFRLLTKSSGLFDTKSLSSRARTASTKKKTAAGDGADEEELMMQEADGDAGADDYLDPEEKKRVSMDNIDDEDEDEDAEDLDLDEGEGDTTAMKHRTRLNQEREYEEADQEEMEDDESDNEQLEDDGTVPIGGVKEEEDDVTVTMINQKNNSKLISGVQLEGVHAERRTRVLNNGRGIVMDYTFDTEKELWCEVTLRFELIAAKLDLRSIVMEEAGKAFVHRVGRMDRVFLVKDNEAAKRGAAFAQLIKTEGVSLAHVVEFERMLDLRRIYTNDMHAIANTYGIEAARAALIREISNVFAVYGISVDGRHLSLIADHMTFTGSIKGMNRGAMDGISPLQAMTFETTTSFLKNSLLLDLKDDLHSPSSRLVIGRPTLVGSGLFETRLNPMLLTGLQSPNVTFGTSVLHRSSMGGFGTPMVGPSGLSARPTPHTARRNNQHRILNDTFLTPSMIAPSLLAGRKAATTAGKATKRSAAKMESQPSQEAIVNGSAVKNGTATAAGGEATSSRKATPNSSVTAPTPLAKRIKFEYDTE